MFSSFPRVHTAPLFHALRWVLVPLALYLAALPATAQDSGPSKWYFEVETLNGGLGEAPVALDRETPQGLLESLLAFAERAPEAAAHLLDLSDIPEQQQRAEGARLVQQLHAVIERKVWLDWSDVPDRPDGLSTGGGSDDPMAGEPRRSIRLALLNLDTHPVPIRVARIKAGEADPVWVFQRQTVDNLPALYERYGPTAFERAIPASLKGDAALGLAWWEMIALPIVVGLAVLVGILVHKILKAISDRAPGRLLSDIIHGMALPLAIIAAAAVGWAVTGLLFTFSAPIDAFLTPALTVLIAAALLLLVVHVVDLVIDYLLADDVEELEKPENQDRRRFQTNLSAARRIGLVLLFVAAVALVLMQTNAFGGMGVALLGSAGIVTLILAYAGRSALSNIMSSLQIAMSKSAKIGDAVMFEGQWAYVEKINFTYVQLKTWDQRRLIVPVTRFTSEPFENWTKRDPSMLKVVELRLNHFTNVDALRERFFAWVQTRDDIEHPDDCKVLVIGHDRDGMLVRFYSNAKDPSTAWDMHCAMREAMLKAAAELDPAGEYGSVVLPAEREAKIADFSEDRSFRAAAE